MGQQVTELADDVLSLGRGYRVASPGDLRSAAATIFGHLVILASPILTSYSSDLFHDALWLDAHVTGQRLTFFFGVRDCGTHIGTQADLIEPHNDRVWRVVVACPDAGHWTATFVKIKDRDSG